MIRHEADWAQRGEAGTIVGRAVSEAVLNDGTIDLDELGTIAHKHPQRGITKYMHPHLTRRHREVHEWTDDARIAHDGSAWWGADATANAYVTTRDTAIGNKEAVFWLCHKLAIVPTFLPSDPRCAVGCDKGGRETLSADALQHGWHQAACTMYSGVTLRHDQYLEEMAKTMRRDLGVLALTGQYLNRDYASKRSTDLYIVFPGSIDELPVAVDYTCACPFLDRYRNTAKNDFKKFMERREQDKVNRHAEWCINHRSKRNFVAAVGTTLGGVGGDAFQELFNRIFMRAMVKDQIAGGSGFGVQEQKQTLKQRLQAIVINYTAQHVITLTEDGERGRRGETHHGGLGPTTTQRGSAGRRGGRRARGRGRSA